MYYLYREQASAYVKNPTTWDTKRGLKRAWTGEPVPGSSSGSSGSSSGGTKSKPTSTEKGNIYISMVNKK